MDPMDLSTEPDFGHPGFVRVETLAVASSAAADAVAWRLAEAAAREQIAPLDAFHTYRAETDRAITAAKERLFARLVVDAQQWISSFTTLTPEWESAVSHVKTILECRDGFEACARNRIERVLSAASHPQSSCRPSIRRPIETNRRRGTGGGKPRIWSMRISRRCQRSAAGR